MSGLPGPFRRMPHHWPLPAQYALALAAVALALGLRWLIGDLVGNRFAFAFVLGALLPLVLLVRSGPFLAATLLGWAGLVLLLQPQAGTPAGGATSWTLWIGTAIFALPVTAAWLARRMLEQEQLARKRAQEREQALAAEALAATAKFRSVFNQPGIFAGITDLEGNVREANELCLTACGYRLEDVVGKPFWQTPWWRGSAEVRAEIREAAARAAAGEAYRKTLPYWTADGTERAVDFAMHPIRDEAGTVMFLHPTGIDVTEQLQARRELAESEERLRVATGAAALGLHDFDVAGGTVEWDSRTRELFGVEPGQPVTYERWRDCVLPEDREAAERAVARALDPAGDGQYLAQYRVVDRGSGGVRWIEVTGRTTFRQGRPVRLVGTTQDITERKRTEQALREADRRKDEFLATLAHELRNPLAAIRAALAVLDRGSADPALVDEMKRVIERQLLLLVRLIDDLMDVSRISRGTIRLERRRTDICAAVQQALEDARAALAGRSLVLEAQTPQEPVVIEADPTRLGQILHNLIHNACKFTPDGGRVSVAVAREPGEVLVRVRDSGIGLTRDQRQRIFEMFVQLGERPSQKAGGLGIGLPLARTLVELHGGAIEAHSDGLGRGAELIVRLPVPAEHGKLSHEPESPAASVARSPGTLCRIVVADDNQDALQAVAWILRQEGHEVITATAGFEAFTAIEAQRPAAALLDIGMPGMDGYEIAQRVRREPWGEGMLLIAMTGWGQDRDKQRALEAGFDVHLTKPVDPTLLARTVAECASRKDRRLAAGTD